MSRQVPSANYAEGQKASTFNTTEGSDDVPQPKVNILEEVFDDPEDNLYLPSSKLVSPSGPLAPAYIESLAQGHHLIDSSRWMPLP